MEGRGVLPSLDSLLEIAQRNSQNPRETYKLLKGVTIPYLQTSKALYRRQFVALCLDEAEVATSEGEILVGFLLLSGMGLASGSTWTLEDVRLVERLCQRLNVVDVITMRDWRARDGAYALTLVKNLNTVALGLLSNVSRQTSGRVWADEDLKHIEGVVLMIVACMDGVGRAAGAEVWVRVAKVVVTMAPHGREVERWIDAVSLLVDACEGLEYDGGDARRRVADVVEEGISCVRRMMVGASSGSSGFGGFCIVGESVAIRLLVRVSWLYALDGSRDGHAGLAAVGAVGKAMSGPAIGAVSQPVIEAFGAAMCRLEALQSVDAKEMVWLAGVLYAAGRVSREQGWLLEWSLRCNLVALRLGSEARDEAIITRCCSDIVQCVMVSVSGMLAPDTLCALLVDVFAQLRGCGRDGDVSSLMSRVIKRVHRVHQAQVGQGGRSELGELGALKPLGEGDAVALTARSILDAAYRSVKDKGLWADLVKDAIGALAGIMRETRLGEAQGKVGLEVSGGSRCISLEAAELAGNRIFLDAAGVLDFAHEAFNPGKMPQPYVEVLVACHAHMDAFPDLMSIDALRKRIDSASEKTTTKIGKKRIEDVAAVVEMLQVEAAVGGLLKASQEHGEKVALKRKKALRKDPTLIHSDEWVASDSLHESVAFMLGNSSRWQAVVQDAVKALSGAGKATNAMQSAAAQTVEEELAAFVRLHMVQEADCLADPTKRPTFWSIMLWLDEQGAERIEGGESMAASMRHARSGNLCAALSLAIEGQRQAELRRNPARRPNGPSRTSLGLGAPASSAGQSLQSANRWWFTLESHLIHSAWTGFLFSVCGMYNEARLAYSAGLRTSCQVGAAPMAAYFSAVLAELHLVGSEYARFSAHACDAVKILAAGTLANCSGDCAARLLSAHVDVLRCAMDRHQLEFALASERLSSIEDARAPTSWYGARIAASAAWQEAMLELDQETNASTELVNRRMADLESAEYGPVLLGAPHAMTIVLLAQALAVPFFDDRSKNAVGQVLGDDQFRIWAACGGRDHSKSSEEEDCTQARESSERDTALAVKLGCLAASLHGTPFCQRIVLQLLAPVVATLGHKYAAVGFLHASSNPTLEFQQTLVACMKGPKDPDAGSLPPRSSASSCATLLDAVAHDIDSLEDQARSMVRGWTSNVSNAVICGITVYSRATFGPLRPRRDRLVLHRIRHGQAPLIIEVPSPEVQSSHPIHQLSGTKACGAIQSLGDRLQDILKRSNRNMRGVSAASSEAEQRSWWQERVNLDHSMQLLLQELQTDWIGPWRCLFSGDDDVPIPVDGPIDEAEEERALLRRLLGSARLSAMEVKSISMLLGSLDIDAEALADEFQERLRIGKGQDGRGHVSKMPSAPNVARQVSFSAAGGFSPEHCSVVRSAALGIDDGGLGDGDGIVASGADDSPERVHGSPTRSHVTIRRKHKSRLAHLQSLATPNPRRALGARNFAGPSHQTPMPKDRRGLTRSYRGENVPLSVPVLSRKGGRVGYDPCDAPDTAAESVASVSVLLVLDHAVQALPWESSFFMMDQTDASGDDPIWEFYRVPSLPAALSTPAQSAPSSRADSLAIKSIDSTFYVINPSGDLVSTQETFETWFKNLAGWSGVSGRVPTPDELGIALEQHDLFVYCGHGGAEQYLPASRLRSLGSCASSILMGCSSAKLTTGGVYDASGVPLSYLTAGSHAVVGNLWDVTDKDIDRYCTALLTAMLENPQGKANIGALVQRCRLNCRLMYLIGASPVVYGLPVRFRSGVDDHLRDL
jgi:hypothetical protein